MPSSFRSARTVLRLATLAAAGFGLFSASRSIRQAVERADERAEQVHEAAEMRSSNRAGGLLVGLAGFIVVACLAWGSVRYVQAKMLTRERASLLTGGDPDAGRAAIANYACGGCHAIPDVAGANGMVGPSLQHFASREMIAGRYENTPRNAQLWIMHPQLLDRGVAMPEMGVKDHEARDIAAYLYTLT